MESWKEITADTEFQALDEGSKRKVLDGYYKDNVASDPEYTALSPDQQAKIYQGHEIDAGLGAPEKKWYKLKPASERSTMPWQTPEALGLNKKQEHPIARQIPGLYADHSEKNVFEKVTDFAKDPFGTSQGSMNPADVADAQIKTEARSKGLTKEAYVREVNPDGGTAPRLERTMRNFEAGALGTAEGMAGGMEALTGGAIGRDFANEVKKWRGELASEEQDLLDEVASGAGSMATFFIPGMGISKSAALAAKVSEKAALWAGSSAAAALEASTEAGLVYREMMEKHGQPQLAEQAAMDTFFQNLVLVGATNKLGVFSDRAKGLAKLGITMATEGGQEGGQNIISTTAQGEPIDWKQAGREALVGGIVGGGVSMIGKRAPDAPMPDPKTTDKAVAQRGLSKAPPVAGLLSSWSDDAFSAGSGGGVPWQSAGIDNQATIDQQIAQEVNKDKPAQEPLPPLEPPIAPPVSVEAPLAPQDPSQKPRGYIPADEYWDKTPGDLVAEWDGAMSHVQRHEDETRPKIEALEAELKGMKGLRNNEKRKGIKDQIAELEGGVGALRAEYEEGAIQEQSKLREQAWQKAQERGLVDEAQIEDFVVEFQDAVSDQRPYLERNHGKKVSDIFDEVIKPYLPTDTAIDEAAHEAATSTENDLPEPTEAQIEAGNYKKGHINVHGLDISIENPKGSARSGKDKTGREWSQELKSHYGYIKRTEGADGDQVDVFVGEDAGHAEKVYVIDQVDPTTGKFDEHKVMLGYGNVIKARKAYFENYEKGWAGLGSIKGYTIDEFKAWLKEGSSTATATSATSATDEKGKTGVSTARPKEHEVGAATSKPDDRDSRKDEENKADFERAKLWGFTELTTNKYGWAKFEFPHKEQIELQAPRKGGSSLNSISLARSPNGKWASTINVALGNGGGGSAPGIHDTPFDTREEALLSAISELRAYLSGRMKEGVSASDKAYGERLLKELGALEVKAKAETPDGKTSVSTAKPKEQEAEAVVKQSEAKASGVGSLTKDEFNGMISEVVDERKGPAKVKISKSAADFLAEKFGLKEEAEDYIDEALYAETKPYFEQILKDFAEGGQSAKDFVRHILDTYNESIIPYLKRFHADLSASAPAPVDDTVEVEAPQAEPVTEPEPVKVDAEEEESDAEGEDTIAIDVTPVEDKPKKPRKPKGEKKEKTPRPDKLKDAGEQMAGKKSQADRLKEEFEHIKDLKKVLDKSAKVNLWPTPHGEGVTPGTGRFVEVLRDRLPSFLEWAGSRMGGTRRRWGASFSKALQEKAETPTGFDEIKALAVTYADTLATLAEATKGATTVKEAEAALQAILVKPEFFQALEKDSYENPYHHLTELGHKIYNLDTRFVRDVVKNDLASIYMADEHSVKAKDKKLIRPRLSNVQREDLPERREGNKDIAGEDMIATFGFRGVEFGEWVNGKERQLNANLAYDSYYDLIEAVGAPTKGAGLPFGDSGRHLGMAFGSRGSGSASAHYEPGNHVINLTKTRGDGTVAHEWGHAFDKALRVSGVSGREAIGSLMRALSVKYDLAYAENLVKEILSGSSTYWKGRGKTPIEVAKVFLQTEWKGWVKKDTEFKKSSAALGEYWDKDEEKFARAFEAYIYDKLEGTNPYLVSNWVDGSTTTKENGYRQNPYPAGDERTYFNTLFDQLFENVVWGENGAPSIKPGYVPSTTFIHEQAQAYFDTLIEKLEEMYRAIQQGEPSQDGNWWYYYNSTRRGPMLQPKGHSAYDDKFKLDSADGGVGAIGYSEPLHPDEVLRYDLKAFIYEKGETTIYLKGGEDGRSDGIRDDGEEPLGEMEAEDGRGTKTTGGVPRSPQNSSGDGQEGAGEQDDSVGQDGHGVGGGSKGGFGGIHTPAGREGSANAEPGQDALPGGNYRFDSDDATGQGYSVEDRFFNNVSAIRLLKELEKDGRKATKEEQDVLAKYVGWGGMSKVFDRWTSDGWSKRQGLLKELLTTEEYTAASSSTQYAFYTPVVALKAMWGAVEAMGFKGGRVLEPAAGIGHFFGFVPEALAGKVKFTGVEADSLSARIAKQLYQNAAIQHSEIQEAKLPRNQFDLAISNVPFSDTVPYDKAFNKDRLVLHDYFFNKSLDLVRPGGIVAFMTSKGTMDKLDKKAREALAQKAELVAAWRLPKDLFEDTEVVTDVIFLRKKGDGLAPLPEAAWMETQGAELMNTGSGYKDTIPVNEYFASNSKAVLGEMAARNGRYGVELTVVGRGDISTALATAVSEIPRSVYQEATWTPPDPAKGIPAPDELKDGSFAVQDGKLYQNNSGVLQPIAENTAREKAAGQIIRGMIPLRTTIRKLLRAQMLHEPIEVSKDLQKQLGKLYDAFVKKHGFINTKKVIRAIADDPEAPRVMALEKWNEDTQKATKSDIFSGKFIEPQKQVDHVDKAVDAIPHSLNNRGRIDLDYIGSLTGLNHDQLIKELEGVIFNDPETGWVPADEYLSGNVRAKLKVARTVSQSDKAYEHNVKALEAVQPEDLPPSKITARLGAAWVEPTDIRDFVGALLPRAGDVKVDYIKELAYWNLSFRSYSKTQASRDKARAEGSVEATSTWGTKRMSFFELLECALNGGQPKVYDKVNIGNGKTESVLNNKETDAANAKLQAIQERFGQWIWEDAERADRLVRKYNDEYNNIRARAYDGSHLTFPGKVHDDIIRLMPHQASAVWRALTGTQSAYLAHEVGAGKTFAMAAIAMEAKRLGLKKKTILLGMNANVDELAEDILRLYPGANVLRLDLAQDKLKRKAQLHRIATNDWDVVVINHESFSRVKMSPEAQGAYIQTQITDYRKALELAQASRASKDSVKQIEKTIKKLEEKLKGLADKRDAEEIYFEELGVDMVMVDEAHRFKNLGFPTAYRGIKGVNPRGSGRATDLHMKSQWRHETYGGGLILASGTPVTNSVGELFTISRYLQPGELAKKGLTQFDAWAKTFGEITQKHEYAPEGGGYRAVTKFASFINVPELSMMVRQVMDVVKADDAGVKRPAMLDGKMIPVVVPQNSMVEGLSEELKKRAEALRGGGKSNGPVHPRSGKVDIMLTVVADGRKGAIDMRLIDPTLPDHEDSKVNYAVPRILKHYEDSRNILGTQLVFLDLGVPKTSGQLIVSDGFDESNYEDYADEDWYNDLLLASRGESSLDALKDELQPADFAALKAAYKVIMNKAKVQALTDTVRAGGFNVYDDLKRKLIAKGIPASEIAFIQDAKTAIKKKELFRKVREGKIRVLIGSTGTMGTGVNVQDRIVAMHHLDTDWNFGGIDQRNGRGLRQGNILYELSQSVAVYTYATKGTVDAFMWDKVASKKAIVDQVLTGDPSLRVVEDISQDAVSANEMVALTSGNPMIAEKFQIETDMRRLQNIYQSFLDNKYQLQRKAAEMPGRIAAAQSYIEAHKIDLEAWKQITHIKFGDEVFDLKKNTTEVNERVKQAFEKALKNKLIGTDSRDKSTLAVLGVAVLGKTEAVEWKKTIAGLYGRVSLAMSASPDNVIGAKAVHNDFESWSEEGLPTPNRLISNTLERIPKNVEDATNEIVNMEQEQVKALEELKKPFDKQVELEAKGKRLQEVIKELALVEEAASPQNDGKAGEFFVYSLKDKRWQAVTGKAVALPFGVEGFIHVSLFDPTRWVVSEKSTGVAIENRATEEEAIAEATQRIERIGEERAKGDLLKLVNEQGPAPYPANALREEEGGYEAPARTAYAPTFYSQMERTLENKLPSTGAPAQYKALVENWAGKGEFKAEELRWSGLTDWLLEQTGKVTKEQVLGFVKANQVEIEEVLKGTPVQPSAEGMAARQEVFDKWADRITATHETIYKTWDGISKQEQQALLDEYHRLVSARDAEADAAYKMSVVGESRYDKWVLPGGKDYRELLLKARDTLTSSPVKVEFGRPEEKALRYGGVQVVEGVIEYPVVVDGEVVGSVAWWPKTFDWQGREKPGMFIVNTPQVQNGRHSSLELAKERITKEYDKVKERATSFNGSHWREPNVFAHVRFNDRLSPDGKRVLLLEEVQSDWHQKGRDNGYRVLPKREAELRATIEKVLSYGADATPEQKQTWVDAMNELQPDTLSKKVPDAPFKKTWHELVLKRMLRYAAENGYDRLAITPGAVQAKRYDLWKVIDRIQYEPITDPAGTYKIIVYGKNGKTLAYKEEANVEGISELVGKEVARQIVAGEGRKMTEWPLRNWSELTGLALKVGGEGMAGFYDKILPSFLNKYAKKWGARVETMHIKTSVAGFPESTKGKTRAVHAIDITPAMRASVLSDGQTLFEKGVSYDIIGQRNKELSDSAIDFLRNFELSFGGRKNIRPIQGEAGAGVRTTGLGITRELAQKGYIDLRGRKAETVEEVAAVAQVFRNPSFETLRYVYTKDGVVVATEGRTSRLPGATVGFVRRDDKRELFEIRNRMKRLGADGIWLVHNHPSGDPTPSEIDKRFTLFVATQLPQLKGHVVINSGKFATIDIKGLTQEGGKIAAHVEVDVHTLADTNPGLLNPSIEHPLLGKPVLGYQDMVRYAQALKRPDDYVTVVYRDVKNIRAIQEAPIGLLNTAKGFADFVRGRAREFGAQSVFVVMGETGYNEVQHKSLVALVGDGTLMDALIGAESVRGYVKRNADPNTWIGASSLKGYKVAEDEARYDATTADAILSTPEAPIGRIEKMLRPLGMTDKDMGRLETVFNLPWWMSKTHSEWAAAIDIELLRQENREQLLHQLLGKTTKAHEGEKDLHEFLALPRHSAEALFKVMVASDQENVVYLGAQVERIEGDTRPFLQDKAKEILGRPLTAEEVRAYYAWKRTTDKVFNLIFQEAEKINYLPYEGAAWLEDLKKLNNGELTLEKLQEKYSGDDIKELEKAYKRTNPFTKSLKNLRKKMGRIRFYVPRVRGNGKYAVRVYDTVQAEEGDEQVLVWREHASNQWAAAKLKEKLEAQFPGKRIAVDIQKGPSEFLYQSVSDTAVERFIEESLKKLKGRGEVDEAGVDALRDSMLEVVAEHFKERAFSRHMIKRKDGYAVGGYQTEDGQKLFVDYLSGLSGYLTKQEAAFRFREVLKTVDLGKPQVFEELSVWVKDMLRNTTDLDVWSGRARGVAFAYFLAGNLKSAAVQLSQNFVTGIPMLARETKGATVKYLRAMKDVATRSYSPEEKEMLHQAFDKGITRAQYVDEVKGQLRSVTGRVWKNLIDVLSVPFSAMETYNRKSAFLAMYRVQVAKGRDHDQAFKAARDFVYDTHYLMGKANLPAWARGGSAYHAGARTLYTFRSYTHNYLNSMVYVMRAHDEEGLKTLLASLAWLVALGGMTAVPFLDDLLELGEKWLGIPFRENAVKVFNSLGGELGEKIGMFGLPALVGVTISGSLKIGIPVVVEGPSDTVYGVMGGIAQKLAKAVDILGSGQWGLALEKAGPVFTENVGKGVRGILEGVKDGKGRAITDEKGRKVRLSPVEAVGQAVGFTPARTAGLNLEKRVLGNVRGRHNEWKDDIVVNFGAADSKEERHDVLEDVRNFNKKSLVRRGIVSPITAETLNNSRKPRRDKGLRRFTEE